MDFPGGSDGKESACNAGDPSWIPGSGRSPGEGNGNPLYYSCLENSMDRGTWWTTVHGVPKSWTWLSDFHFFQSPSFIDGNTDLREGKSPIKIAQQSARTGTRTKLWAHYLLFQRDRLRGRKAVPGGQDSWG